MKQTQTRLLTDHAWSSVEAAFTRVKPRRGRPSRCDREFLDAVRWILRTGAPWRDLPPALGHWQRQYRRFSRWAISGRWKALWMVLHTSQDPLVQGHQRLCIDSTSIRVHAHGSPSKKNNMREQIGRSRGGRTTKLHLACAGTASRSWRAHRAILSPGNSHDIVSATMLLNHALGKTTSVVADKAYDASWFRGALLQKEIQPTIPSRKDRLPWPSKHAKEYRHRGLVERAFARIKQFRRAASRFARLALHFGAFIQIALAFSLVADSALPR